MRNEPIKLRGSITLVKKLEKKEKKQALELCLEVWFSFSFYKNFYFFQTS